MLGKLFLLLGASTAGFQQDSRQGNAPGAAVPCPCRLCQLLSSPFPPFSNISDPWAELTGDRETFSLFLSILSLFPFFPLSLLLSLSLFNSPFLSPFFFPSLTFSLPFIFLILFPFHPFLSPFFFSFSFPYSFPLSPFLIPFSFPYFFPLFLIPFPFPFLFPYSVPPSLFLFFLPFPYFPPPPGNNFPSQIRFSPAQLHLQPLPGWIPHPAPLSLQIPEFIPIIFTRENFSFRFSKRILERAQAVLPLCGKTRENSFFPRGISAFSSFVFKSN